MLPLVTMAIGRLPFVLKKHDMVSRVLFAKDGEGGFSSKNL